MHSRSALGCFRWKFRQMGCHPDRMRSSPDVLTTVDWIPVAR